MLYRIFSYGLGFKFSEWFFGWKFEIFSFRRRQLNLDKFECLTVKSTFHNLVYFFESIRRDRLMIYKLG